MRFDKFTIKAQEVIQNAKTLAERRRNTRIEPEHLLSAMLEEPGVMRGDPGDRGGFGEGRQQARRERHDVWK